MALDLGSETSVKQERTAQVVRSTPARDNPKDAALAVTVTVQRQIARRDGAGVVLDTTMVTPAYTFTYTDLAASPAIKAYLDALGQPSLAAVMTLEAALYDALVAERKAAAEAAEAAEAARIAAATAAAAAAAPAP